MGRDAYIDGDPTLYRVLGVKAAFTFTDAQTKRHLEYVARALVEYTTRCGVVVRHFVDLDVLRHRRRPRLTCGDTVHAGRHACTFLHWADPDKDIALVQFPEPYGAELISAFELTMEA